MILKSAPLSVSNLQNLLNSVILNNNKSNLDNSKLVTHNNNNQLIKKNQNLKILFNIIEKDFLKLCSTAYLKNLFKYVYINYEKYNYTLVEYICLYTKGQKFSVLDFCAAIGIFIPHYCYHPDLSIAGNCRMCLIQLDGSIKPIASCAITMSNKMIINTQSVFVKKVQEELWNFYY